jgi:hypothetical protein
MGQTQDNKPQRNKQQKRQLSEPKPGNNKKIHREKAAKEIFKSQKYKEIHKKKKTSLFGFHYTFIV